MLQIVAALPMNARLGSAGRQQQRIGRQHAFDRRDVLGRERRDSFGVQRVDPMLGVVGPGRVRGHQSRHQQGGRAR